MKIDLTKFPTHESRTVKSCYKHKPSWKRYGEGYAECRVSLEIDGSLYIHSKETTNESEKRNVAKDTFVSLQPREVSELIGILEKASLVPSSELLNEIEIWTRPENCRDIAGSEDEPSAKTVIESIREAILKLQNKPTLAAVS